MYANNLFTLNNVPTLPVGGRLETSLLNAEEPAVSPNDVIFVNAVQFGRAIIDTALTGFDSMSALMHAVGELLAQTSGLVTVNLRNRTCGWTRRRAIRVNQPGRMMPVGFA